MDNLQRDISGKEIARRIELRVSDLQVSWDNKSWLDEGGMGKL
jgi:hypothetical protein